MRTKITRQQAVDWIVDRFKLTEWKEGETKPQGTLSFYSQKSDGAATFFIDKREFDRYTVIRALQDYFNERCLPHGDGCAIDPLTLLYTVVRICKLDQIKHYQSSNTQNV